jgi:hypothetical protein
MATPAASTPHVAFVLIALDHRPNAGSFTVTWEVDADLWRDLTRFRTWRWLLAIALARNSALVGFEPS